MAELHSFLRQSGLPWWLSGKETACQCRRHGFDPWVGKIYWSRKWWPTPVFLPGKSHRERSLAVKPTVHGLAKEYTNEQINNIQGPAMIFRPLEHLSLDHFQFSSVALSCPTLCDPMNCSTPGLPVHHQLPEFTQTHVHWVSDAIQPSHPLSSPSSPAPNPSQHQYFPVSQLFAWGGQSTGVSALASLLPKKSQGWSPSEWTGWISLQSKGLSRVFSNTTVHSLVLSFLHSPTLTSIHDHWKNHSLD